MLEPAVHGQITGVWAAEIGVTLSSLLTIFFAAVGARRVAYLALGLAFVLLLAYTPALIGSVIAGPVITSLGLGTLSLGLK